MPETTAPADLPAEGSSLLRPELADLEAYVPAVPPGVDVRLDANEAPPARSSAVREAALRAIAAVPLEQYPDPRALRLKEAICKVAARGGAGAGAPRPEEILVGAGSDEVISLLMTAIDRPKKRNTQTVVLTPTPTFVMYKVTARGHGHKPVEVPLDAGWDLDPRATKRAVEMMDPSLVFIASPNNPTGNRMTESRLEEVVESTAKVAYTIVDEAYADYARGTARPMRARHRHLGILRTLSKVGLAALRVGWLEADAALVAEIDKVRQPFNLSATSQAAAAAVLEEAWDEVTADAAAVAKARDALAAAIGALPGFVVTPSEANFLWVKTPSPAESVHSTLVSKGILVRSFHKSGGRLGSQLRITVGTPGQNERLLEALAQVKA